jgi:hypothetical protein
MTTHDGLERQYRRLLAVYPVQHRRAYEDEMVGVLLADAGPDQRRPTVPEAANLLLSALAVRLRSSLGVLREDAWRHAAYAVLLFGSIFLLAVGVRRVALTVSASLVHGVVLPMDPADLFRPLAWALVLVASFTGLRRTASGLAVLAAAMEIARQAMWYSSSPPQVLRMAWLMTTALVVAAAAGWLVTGSELPRPRRLWAGAVAATLLVLGSVVDVVQGWRIVDVAFGFHHSDPIYLAAAGLALWVAVRLPGPVRRRVIAFGAPVAAMVAMVTYGFSGFIYSSSQFDSPILFAPEQWVALVAVPVLSFVVAVVLLERAERRQHWIALGRAAESRAGIGAAGSTAIPDGDGGR